MESPWGVAASIDSNISNVVTTKRIPAIFLGESLHSPDPQICCKNRSTQPAAAWSQPSARSEWRGWCFRLGWRRRVYNISSAWNVAGQQGGIGDLGSQPCPKALAVAVRAQQPERRPG
jgi:hypothetical protein